MRGVSRVRSVRLFSIVCCVVLLFTLPHDSRGDSRGTDESVSPASLPSNDVFKSIPSDYFIENAGQLSNQDVRFYTTSGDMQIGFAESAVLIKIVERPPAPLAKPPLDRELMRSPPPEPEQSRGVLLRLNFEGANKVTPEGRDALPHPTNFFIGNDPARWRTNVRSYKVVAYEGLYDGVDLVYRVTDRGVKYDFIVAPGMNVSTISMSYKGADGLELDETGNMLVHTAIGDIEDSALIAYQGKDEVQCSFVSRNLLSYGFVCDGVERFRELVIDPLLYSTYIGGGGSDDGYSIAVDSDGNAYVTGDTLSADFPVTFGAFDTTFNGSEDSFVAKLDSTGSSLIYATYLGGAVNDEGRSIATDSADNAYVAGYTESTDFPVTPGAFDTTLNGSADSFVAKLDSTGSSLIYSTYLGGVGIDSGHSIAIDSAGNAYVAGVAGSVDFPVTPGAFDTTYHGWGDVFVAKLDSDGSSLVYSTYIGGGNSDEVYSIAIDSAGNSCVTGWTLSSNFPVTPGAFDVTYDSPQDVFVAKLDSTGSSLIYSTYLGGVGNDWGFSISTDSDGNAYVTGATASADFPVTPGAFDITGNFTDAFVAKLDSTGSSLIYSTYLGGGSSDFGHSIAMDSAGNAYVAGDTFSADFPVTPGAYDTTDNGMGDSFVAKLDPTGSSLLYSSYLGGVAGDEGGSIAIDSAGNVYVSGQTFSTDFPVTPSAFDATLGGSIDAFVAKLRLVNSPPFASGLGVQGFVSSPGMLHVSDATPGLNWTYSDPDGDPQSWFNIRVGTAPGAADKWDPPATPGSATLATYGGGQLLRGGDYYFSVKVNDSFSWSSEAEVKFHMNSIPNPPTTPITPAQSLTVAASPSQTVSWTTGGDNESDTMTYEWQVSSDTSFTTMMAQGTTTSTVSASFATNPSATYYWRVRARDDYEPTTWSAHGNTPPGYWTFSTLPPPNTPPTVNITSPVGGEEFLKGSSHTITWTMQDDQDINANLTVYINYTTGGVTNQIVAALKGQLSFAWTLPSIEANDVVVNITVIDTGGLKGWSQSGPFTIKAPSPPPPPPPDFLSQYWWLLVIVVAVVIVLLLLVLMKRRKLEEEEVPPPEPKNPQQSEKQG